MSNCDICGSCKGEWVINLIWKPNTVKPVIVVHVLLSFDYLLGMYIYYYRFYAINITLWSSDFFSPLVFEPIEFRIFQVIVPR